MSIRMSIQAKTKFAVVIKARFLATLMRQDYEFFEAHGAGVLQNRLNSDVEEVACKRVALPSSPVCISSLAST